MSNPDHDEDDQGEVFLDESDIIHEVAVDDEGTLALSSSTFYFFLYILNTYIAQVMCSDLPDVDDDENDSDVENAGMQLTLVLTFVSLEKYLSFRD